MYIVQRTIHGPDKCVHITLPGQSLREIRVGTWIDHLFFSFTCLEKARQGYFRLSGHMEINCSLYDIRVT
jgi:hypothetical protein